MVIKFLNKKSGSCEENIHNLMLLNSSREFREIILKLVNETVRKSEIP